MRPGYEDLCGAWHDHPYDARHITDMCDPGFVPPPQLIHSPEIRVDSDNLWEDIVHSVGDQFGYGWIVGFAALGAIWFLRKKIGRWLSS